jgi:thiopeptide-type bacteriocin biosynthesis protein
VAVREALLAESEAGRRRCRIAGRLAGNALAAGLADSWFFIRYADPDPHLRLRFHGLPDRLSSQLFGQVCHWAGGLVERGVCARFVFDTYDAEIERFGGPEGLAESERLFHADSLRRRRSRARISSREWSAEDDRTTLMALTVDDLLRSAGMAAAARLGWHREQAGKSGRTQERNTGG